MVLYLLEFVGGFGLCFCGDFSKLVIANCNSIVSLADHLEGDFDFRVEGVFVERIYFGLDS
ncbi:hypothetical protein RSP781_24565 [Ralstonia pseudosolanacearum]|nr:hypothetical protein RSP781_24565 [Ralstonia pseudosolanacearum]